MYCVYVLYNREYKKIYIGQTKDLGTRLKLHNDKFFKGYTSRFGGKWVVIYTEEVKDRKEALIREKQLKSYRGRQSI